MGQRKSKIQPEVSQPHIEKVEGIRIEVQELSPGSSDSEDDAFSTIAPITEINSSRTPLELSKDWPNAIGVSLTPPFRHSTNTPHPVPNSS
jgi:hypothetical protein